MNTEDASQALVQCELLLIRLRHWNQQHQENLITPKTEFPDSLLHVFLRRAIETREWVDRFLQLYVYDDETVCSLLEGPVTYLASEYLKLAETTIAYLSFVDNLPQQSRDDMKIETATFLVHLETEGQILDTSVHGRQLIECSERLDKCHRVVMRLLSLEPEIIHDPFPEHLNDTSTTNTSSTTATPDRETLLATMPKAWRQAYLANEYAEAKAGKELTATAAYAWLREHGFDGCELPLPDTFADYRTKAFIHLGEQRKRRRIVDTSRSVVRRSALDTTGDADD